MSQLSIDFTVQRRKTIDERFAEFDAQNPHVYTRLRDMALNMRRRGRSRGSIELFFAALRWEHWLSTDDPSSDFKLNDHFTSRYARKIMAENPDLDGFFETRGLRAA